MASESENECHTLNTNLSEISDLSFSQSFQAPLHRAVLTLLVEGMMNACSAVHQGGDRLSVRQRSP